MRLARFLGAVGRTCITAGTLILLFVVYQLWGTGIREAQAQNRLEDDFAEVLEDAQRTTTTTTTATTLPDEPPVTETAPPIDPVPEGEPTAHIRIPAIGVDKIVVEGVALPDLKKGPGHYPETPLPGQEGNAAIAGHRTTYGAPFNRIDELEPGDEINIETVQGEFTYLVDETLIVSPKAVEVLDDKGDNRLTLSACNPKYSARERIVIVAMLAPDEVALPRPPRSEEDEAAARPALEDIDGAGAPAWPAILLGVVCALIWALAWWIGRHWRKWPSYALGFPFFMVTLFFFFEEFSRLLPSNF
jgi:sortase A